MLQDTYIPGASNYFSHRQPFGYTPMLAPGPGGTVFLFASADPGTIPQQTGPFLATAPGAYFLQRLSQKPDAPVLPLVCQANAASYQIAAIAPGKILALFGSGLGPKKGFQTQATLQTPFPTEAAGVVVTFDGNPAPLLWAQDSQINVIAPWSLRPGQKSEICVYNNGTKTNCQRWPVAETGLGVFAGADGFAVAINQDGSVNSAEHPAPVGSVATVYATGLGTITPALEDGSLVGLPLPSNLLPVTIGIPLGGLEFSGLYGSVDVTYSGPAPYLVAGLSQINFVVADGQFVACTPLNSCAGFVIHLSGQ